MPESVGTLWGSALGAIVAIMGAMWVSKEQQRTQRRNATGLVLACYGRVAFSLSELCDVYGAPTVREDYPEKDNEPEPLSCEEWREVSDSAGILLENYAHLEKKLHRIDSVLNMLGPEELEEFFFLETEVQAMAELVERLKETATTTHVRLYGGPASWSHRFILRVFLNHITDGMKKLEKLAER